MTRALVLTTHAGNSNPLWALLEACHALEVVAFAFSIGIRELIGSIPSNSISLVHLYLPRLRVSDVSELSPSSSPLLFDAHSSEIKKKIIPECRGLGVSLRKIGRRFRDHHPGLKTQVRIIPWLSDTMLQAIHDVEIPSFQEELEQETGSWVTFGLAPELVGLD